MNQVAGCEGRVDGVELVARAVGPIAGRVADYCAQCLESLDDPAAPEQVSQLAAVWLALDLLDDIERLCVDAREDLALVPGAPVPASLERCEWPFGAEHTLRPAALPGPLQNCGRAAEQVCQGPDGELWVYCRDHGGEGGWSL